MTSPAAAAFSYSGTTNIDSERGLTKREWFAGMALAGVMANDRTSSGTLDDTLAKVSVWAADALIAELNK